MSEVAKLVNIHMMTSVQGWGAVYASELDNKDDFPFEVRRLVGTAVISHDDDPDSDGGVVVGMVAEGGEFVPAVSPTFLGYLAPDQSVDEYLPVLEEWKQDQSEAEKLKKDQLKTKIVEEKKRQEN